MIFLRVVLPLVFSIAAFGQVIPGIGRPNAIPPELTRYLELTSDQVSRLANAVASWQAYLNTKSVRAGEVNQEIQTETQRASVDALALGQRYLELEAICREAKDRHSQYMTEARKLLTPAQLTRVATLEQAFELMPVVQAAQNTNLMGSTLKLPPQPFPEGQIEQEVSFIRSPLPTLPGCRPTPQIIRPGIIVVTPTDPIAPQVP